MKENIRSTPSRPLQHPAHVLEDWEKRRKMLKIALFAVPLMALVLALGIWIGSNSGQSDPTEPPPPVTTTAPPETTVPPDAWKTNILRSDEIPFDSFGQNAKYLVFGSNYQRHQISAVTFLDTLSGAPADAWDVSEAGDGSVMAWVEPDGELYRLTLAGEGGVRAGASCRALFSGYTNAARFSFDGNFHTDAVQNMSWMFRRCNSLTSLDLSEKFVTTNADTDGMFSICPAREKYQHLLNN